MAIVAKEGLSEFVRGVLQKIQKTDRAFLIFLSGNLGSGKTTFMAAFAKELGVNETIQSPTFVLMKKYSLENSQEKGDAFRRKASPFSTLIHIDAYRLENGSEFGALKPEEFLSDPNAIVCIEWAENIKEALPEPNLVLKFSSEGMGEGERTIEIQDTKYNFQK